MQLYRFVAKEQSLYLLPLFLHMFTQWRDHLVMYFSEHIAVFKWYMTVFRTQRRLLEFL
jgi:hypothetical protein